MFVFQVTCLLALNYCENRSNESDLWSGEQWAAAARQLARSCCCGVGVSSYTAQGKHHRMSFSSFLKDRMTPHVCVAMFLMCISIK